MIGETLGSYRVVAELGEGGMGVVYVAEHALIGRKAAVKFLRPELSKNKELVDRFFNEARAATVINNPGIVDIFDFGYGDDGSAYIIMEFLEGESLTDRLLQGPMAELDAVRLSRQSAVALAAAHEAGIVHRDLKPDNIFIVPDGEVAGGERIKILDFGIAKLTGDASSGVSQTRTGTIMGSPLYMSPEQCRGAGKVDKRADIYALGCVMYEMLCGRTPFRGEGIGEVIGAHLHTQPTSPRAFVEISARLETVILTALEKRPEERFGSMEELITALDGASDGQFATASSRLRYHTPPAGVVAPAAAITTLGAGAAEMVARPRRKGSVIAAAAILLLAGAGVYAFTQRDGKTTSAAAANADVDAQPRTEEPVFTDREPAPGIDTVTVKITSVPVGASVYRLPDYRNMGVTPFARELPAGEGSMEYLLKMAGHEDHKVTVSLVADTERAVAMTQMPDVPVPDAAAAKASLSSRSKKTAKTRSSEPTATAEALEARDKQDKPKETKKKKRAWGDPLDPIND